MGGGDIKLVAMFGAMLGVKSVFFIIFGSALIGAIVGIAIQTILGKKNMMLPFGPFITVASVVYLFFEPQVNSIIYGI